MALSERKDPFLTFNFAVEIKGVYIAAFNEVSGLQAEIEVQDYREGGVNEYIHKLAGPARYPSNLSLKRGITDATDLWDWYWDVMQGRVARKSISIVLKDSAQVEKKRWNFKEAYPVKWVGPSLRASAAEVAIETLEFAHSGLGGK
jgi:phage tail-like protein